MLSMPGTLISRTTSLLLVLVFLTAQTWATCGGGGGGGTGGMGSGPGMQTYPVPWKVIRAEDTLKDGLALYWLPSSQQELEKSSLRFSQTLSNYASQCITMGILDQRMELGQRLAAHDSLPEALLVQADGTIVGKLENTKGRLNVIDVEKIVDTEMKKRENALKEKMEDAKSNVKSGDSQTAIQEYRAVLDQKCLFPKRAKDAAKELKKLGVTDVAEIQDGINDGINFDPVVMSRVARSMREGLKAENAADYVAAEKFYREAHQIDPADPAPLRYLGELYRHQIGDWSKARETFNSILAMRADPMSRAVALHGLGKMTIHEGDFKRGLELMEASVREYPLALAYRNLAVYWNSEGDKAKADFYTQQALQLEPRDPYNLVFAAAFMAGNGHGDEALKIARENEKLLPASYNLAAIYAQAGQKEKALALLQRHFFEYERNQEVRSKEMMEARVDAVFASLINDSAFLALTKDADGRLPMRMSP